MKTPITESYATHVDRWDSKRGSYQPAGIMVDANVSRRLELDRAALMEALGKIANRHVIAGSTGDYRQGQLDSLSACREVAESALAAARFNFPDED